MDLVNIANWLPELVAKLVGPQLRYGHYGNIGKIETTVFSEGLRYPI